MPDHPPRYFLEFDDERIEIEKTYHPEPSFRELPGNTIPPAPPMVLYMYPWDLGTERTRPEGWAAARIRLDLPGRVVRTGEAHWVAPGIYRFRNSQQENADA